MGTASVRSGWRYWWLYPAEPPRAESVSVEFMPVAGFEQTASGYAFEWPELDTALTEISLDIDPYSEELDCPFAQCRLQNEVAEFPPSPVSVTIPVPQD